MDQLTAYQILRLEPGSSPEEIKTAYARLSKEFHPEEHPEEFQQIHEAYTTLTRGARRGDRRHAVRNEVQNAVRDEVRNEVRNEVQNEVRNEIQNAVRNEVHEIDPPKQESNPRRQENLTENLEENSSTYRFEEAIENAQENRKEKESAYDFEDTLEKAQEEERRKDHQLTLQALAEMELLLSVQYRNKTKLFREFFRKEKYQKILKGQEFLLQLSQWLTETKLKKTIYDVMIDYYRLRGLDPKALTPEAAALYRVLDDKRGMRAKQKENAYYAIPAGIFVGLRSALRGGADATVTFAVLAIGVIIAILGMWGYRKLYENHSSIFSQTIIALAVMVIQIIALFSDMYAPALGVDGGLVASVLIFCAAGIWLLVLGIAAILVKIKNRHC
ncbi:MAG: DnaJ domain-containing protein [Lachnospiraceae bacterium]|jgi:curved DNA-binding protein CbpA